MSILVTPNGGAIDAMRRVAFGDLRDFAEVMAARTKENSPVQTGHNRDSIDFQELAGKEAFQIFTQSNYGAWLELGTSRMKARPYFAPAFQQTASEMGMT